MRSLKLPGSASTRRACGGCWRLWSGGTFRTPVRSPWRAGASRAGRRSRCRSSRRFWPIRRPGICRLPRMRLARSSSSGGSSTIEVAELLPGAEALVMPSTFPEAFGMVAAEAAACGVLPVSAGHSGMLEVSRQLMAALPPEIGRLTSFPVEQGAVEAIADRLNGWLALSERRAGGRRARHWSRPRGGSGAGRASLAGCWRRPPAAGGLPRR